MKLPWIDRAAPRPLLGLCIMYPAPGVIERIGPDWDWLWIDAQHGDLDYREMANLVRASHLIHRPGLVRVPSHDESWIGKILDAGAAGVIVPMVETVAEARRMVHAAKFPPLGNRSYGGRRVIDLLGRSYYESANRDSVLILQVESNSACGIADELAAVDGVDGLFLGPDDLVIREGLSVDTPKDKSTIGKQLQSVTEACHRHGKLSVCAAGSEPGMEMAAALGCDLFVGGGDVRFLAEGSRRESDKLKEYFFKAGGSGSAIGQLY